jgi:hypothetical protein
MGCCTITQKLQIVMYIAIKAGSPIILASLKFMFSNYFYSLKFAVV